MKTIIVANSPQKSFSKLYQYQKDDYLIGVDGGALTIINKGYELDLAIGDFDSTSDLNTIKKRAKLFLSYPPVKNETDLELAIQKAPTDEIEIYDALGYRLDHELIALLLLRKYHYLHINIINQYNKITYLKEGTYQIKKDNYKYFSIINLTDCEISTKGSKYDLDHQKLTYQDTFTSSNEVLLVDECEITIHHGSVYLIKTNS